MKSSNMNFGFSLCFFCLLSTHVQSGESSAIQPLDLAAGMEFFISHDSEGFETKKISAEVFPQYINANDYLGARFSAYNYKIDDWQSDAYKVSIIAKNVEAATANGWTLEAGVFEQNDHTLATFDGSYRQPLTKSTAVEVFANRDWVETRPALEQGIHFTYLGGAVDQQIGPHVTVVGLAATQLFSDDNRRDHGRLKLIYQPSLEHGLTLQARYRMYQSDADDVAGLYFNPKDYEESMLALGWRQRYKGWMTGITLGYGREKVADAPSQSTELLELNIQSPIHQNQFVRLNAGYSNSASYYGADYSYHYLMGEWVLKF